jgi:hypothetical protein
MYILHSDQQVLSAGQNCGVQCEYNIHFYQLHKPVGARCRHSTIVYQPRKTVVYITKIAIINNVVSALQN